MFPENRYWRRRRDVHRQSVPQSGSSDRKRSIADGWKTGAWDHKRWCRCRAETLTSLVNRWLMEFLNGGAVWCRHVYTKTVQLCQEWLDAVVPRCRKHKPSSRIQHRLHPLDQTGQSCLKTAKVIKTCIFYSFQRQLSWSASQMLPLLNHHQNETFTVWQLR